MKLKLFEKKESLRDRLTKKYNITKFGPGSIGLDEKKGIWYGWSHRALSGFKIGDKKFFGDENAKSTEQSSKTIKTLDDAKESAKRFSDDVS